MRTTAAAPGVSMENAERSIPDAFPLEHWLTLVAPTKAAQRMFKGELLSLVAKSEEQADLLLNELEGDGI